MTSTRARFVGAMTVVVCLAIEPSAVAAQGIEVAPFGGYRFGGGFFELVTRQPVDLDGAPVLGVVVDVPLPSGMQVEGLFTHQRADVLLPTPLLDSGSLWRMTVDHWLGGGLQEFRGGRVRPFLTGTLGLTRYAAAGDSEIRFAVSAGGGVKLFPSPHVGVRLDGRLFATFVDADATFVACAPGTCILAFHTDVVWQAEFTAGVVFRFR